MGTNTKMSIKKNIFIVVMLLISLSAVLAEPVYEKCEDPTDLNSPCTMVTPTLSCNNLNYNITRVFPKEKVVTEGSLELLNDSIYFFNFTEGQGQYIIRLCDGTTREVVVKASEEKMIAVIIGLSFIIALLVFFGWTSKTAGFRLLFFGLAAMEFLFLVGFMYAENAGIDFTTVLKLNLTIFFLLVFLVGSLKLFFFVLALIRPDNKRGDIGEVESKWGRTPWKG